MAAKASDRRVAGITVVLTVVLLVAAFAAYYPTVPRGMLGWIVLVLGALPIWAIVRSIDRYAALRGSGETSAANRTVFVAITSAAAVAILGALVYVAAAALGPR